MTNILYICKETGFIHSWWENYAGKYGFAKISEFEKNHGDVVCNKTLIIGVRFNSEEEQIAFILKWS